MIPLTIYCRGLVAIPSPTHSPTCYDTCAAKRSSITSILSEDAALQLYGGHLVNIYKPPTPPPLLTWINIHSEISSLVWQICLSNWKAGKISHILPLSALLSLLLCLSLFNPRVGWHDRINRPLFLHWHIISPWQLHQWVGGSCETGYNPPCHWQRTTIVPVSPAILLFLPLISSFTVHPHSSSIDNNKLSYAARHKSGNKEGTGPEQEPNRDRGN